MTAARNACPSCGEYAGRSPAQTRAGLGAAPRSTRMWTQWAWTLALGLLVCVAHADGPGEYQIKAAFVCKFGSYVEWPPSAFAAADAPLVVAVAGTPAVVDEFMRTASEHGIGSRPVSVRRVGRGDPLTGVHIVFVTRGQGDRLPEIAAALRGLPVLLVTEMPSGTAPGSAINFVVVNDRVRFDVVLAPAESSNLKISARLLAVARRVMPG